MSITHNDLAIKVAKIAEKAIERNKSKMDAFQEIKKRFDNRKQEVEATNPNNIERIVYNSAPIDSKPVMKPIRHIQQDLFIADWYTLESSLYGERSSLEYPLFALKSTKEPRIYKKDGFSLAIRPSALHGTPTVYDADLWVYAISKLIKAMDDGEPLRRSIRFTAYDFLVTTNRDTSKRQYDRLIVSLERLHEATIYISHEWSKYHERPKFVPADVDGQIRAFHFIDGFVIGRDKKTKRMEYIEITLPNWLFEGIEKRATLKLSDDYFRISSPLHRRLYEIARKHCGNQSEFTIRLDNLKEKVAYSGNIRKFKQQIKNLQSSDMPDYAFELTKYHGSDIVTIRPKTKGDDIQ